MIDGVHMRTKCYR